MKSRIILPITLFITQALLLSAQAMATEFHVTANGSASGDGSLTRPWDLKTALAHPPSVRPGDTIWIRGGTYLYPNEGLYSSLNGTASQPIVVRAYPGERAAIKAATFYIGHKNDNFTWFWGLELVNRDLVPGQNYGFYVSSSTYNTRGIRLINNIVHNNSCGGISSWGGSSQFEAYGNIVYNNGYQGSSRGHCHGFYLQSQVGPQDIEDNIVFRNFHAGIQLYGTSAAALNNIHVTGNFLFNTSEPSSDGAATEIYFGAYAGTKVNGGILKDNLVYKSPHRAYNWVQIGQANSPVITGNYFMIGAGLPGVTFNWENTMSGTPNISGNTVLANTYNNSQSLFPNNTYLTARPNGLKVFVRPNRYEPGRANIAILNWDLAPTVSVNVSGIITPGTVYELRDVNNFFGNPILSGTYNGGSLTIPMTGLTLAPAIGAVPNPPTVHPGPEFGAFVLIPKSSSPTPTHRCDLDASGGISVADVQICANQAIGLMSCANGDVDSNGACNVLDLQKVVNGALGGSCP